MVRFSHIAAACAGLLLSGCAAQAGLQSASQSQPLFNGRDLAGWELVTLTSAPLEASFTVRPDGVVASTGLPVGYLASTGVYRDYSLHVEWRWSGQPGNAGVLLHIVGGPKDRNWPESLQVQTKHGAVGDLLPMAGARFADALTSAPGAAVPLKSRMGAASEKPLGEWNSVDIVSRAGTLEVTVNGVAQNRVDGARPASGRIGFQLEGAPYELRNVSLRPLP